MVGVRVGLGVRVGRGVKVAPGPAVPVAASGDEGEGLGVAVLSFATDVGLF